MEEFALRIQLGLLNIILLTIVLFRIRDDCKKFRDCTLFFRLIAVVISVNFIDTIGWCLDGRLLGSLSRITAIVDNLNLLLTEIVAWCWVEYTQFLVYDDEGVPEKKNYLSKIFCIVSCLVVFVSFPKDIFFVIDEQGKYCRRIGFYFFALTCLLQIFYSFLLCLIKIVRKKEINRRSEILFICIVSIFPLFGIVLQSYSYGYPLIWLVMTIVIFLVYVHIQNKRRLFDNLSHEQKLQEALQQAQYASKAKTDFLSNMSHDIRTPMNAIVGFTAIAANHIDEKNLVIDCLSKITTASNHLLNLINDVLDMSRIESGKMHLQLAPCNLKIIMHDLVDLMQSQISSNQLDFYIDTLHVQDEEIIADAMKLNQVFINLIGNAIKFNKPGGFVSMRIEQKESVNPTIGSYVFIIKDNGCGIEPKYLKHVFEPFERGVQDNQKDKVEGSGLGLAIVKSIVEIMGGTISVTSELGKGTEFKIGLSFGLQTNKDIKIQYDKLCGLRALVVDDDYNSCDSVCTMLQGIGMDSEWTMSGKEAVLKARKASEIHKPYAAYIIDWLMPDMNGIEVTRRIRTVVGIETPIFILTAYDWSDIEEEAKEAGVTAFCRKPLFMSDLRTTLFENTEINKTKTLSNKEQVMSKKFYGKRVLLAEDHPLNKEIAIRLLSDKGFIVDSADDGQIAYDKFRLSEVGHYDFILMDIRMPNLNGIESTKKIRQLDKADAKTVPIIAMTANAFDEDVKKCLEVGMNAHLAKPIDPTRLFNTLADVFNKK